MPLSLLIIDDSKPLHDLIRVHLGDQDFAIESAFTGSAALDLAARIRPDLILLDVDLPDMNGYDVCRFLKANPITAPIPLVFLTASSSIDERMCGLGLQAADYVTKPFDREELLACVRSALRAGGPVGAATAGDSAAATAASRTSTSNVRSTPTLKEPAAAYEGAGRIKQPSTIASG